MLTKRLIANKINELEGQVQEIDTTTLETTINTKRSELDELITKRNTQQNKKKDLLVKLDSYRGMLSTISELEIIQDMPVVDGTEKVKK